MSTSATTRRARIAALALAVTMVLTMAGGAIFGTASPSSSPAPSTPTPTTEAVVDLSDLTEAELAALLDQYGAAPAGSTATDPAPAP